MSRFEFNPIGLLDPVSCNNIKWIITKAKIIKGIIKWNEKNRVNVALFKENPPQIHWTIFLPKYGMADRRFVITVAPQNDICPQGNT